MEENGAIPVTLIGFSWRAMLSFILTVHYPQFVKKRILIGSSPFEEKYAANIMNTRMKPASLRSSGKLPELGKNILCPVVVIHRD
ncbi:MULTISPECIES: alpha/beta fold hydrolase [unclassified Methanosarcina]|uniref:alpha/beta fold hydrolase n=1 Tax=unclassified Methanosarcina TaxID=2644672 RepID=UPI0012E0274F|nr:MULTISPECIES: alpha/beta hydrolase [unclassified Methanosarcina]